MQWLRSLPARVGRYLREVRTELRKVVWPDRRQTVVYTAVVVVSVTMVAAMIWVVDTILSTGLSLLLFGA
jgi:preprotein translocase subunit SecE